MDPAGQYVSIEYYGQTFTFRRSVENQRVISPTMQANLPVTIQKLTNLSLQAMDCAIRAYCHINGGQPQDITMQMLEQANRINIKNILTAKLHYQQRALVCHLILQWNGFIDDQDLPETYKNYIKELYQDQGRHDIADSIFFHGEWLESIAQGR